MADNLSILVSSEDSPPYEGFHMHLRSGDHLNLYNDVTSLSEFASGAIPRDRWFCLQMHVVVHGLTGEYHVLVDGTEVITATGADTRPSLGYRRIGVGIPYTAASQPPATVYADEVAVARGPIPCD